MSIYKYEFKSAPLYFEVILSGELRGGNDIESDDFSKLLKRIRSEAESGIVFVNIQNVAYWDTEGMRKVLGLVQEINSEKEMRACVVGPKNTKLFDRAKEKYQLDSDEIPWKNSTDEFLIEVEEK